MIRVKEYCSVHTHSDRQSGFAVPLSLSSCVLVVLFLKHPDHGDSCETRFACLQASSALPRTMRHDRLDLCWQTAACAGSLWHLRCFCLTHPPSEDTNRAKDVRFASSSNMKWHFCDLAFKVKGRRCWHDSSMLQSVYSIVLFLFFYGSFVGQNLSRRPNTVCFF